MRFALETPAKPIETVEVATLFGERTHAARRCTRNTTTESVGAVEVAAVDRRGAG